MFIAFKGEKGFIAISPLFSYFCEKAKGMYRLNDIVNSFKSLVGWEKENTDIDEAITASDSGLYFQEAHPLLTLRAMRSIMPEDYSKRYEDYTRAKTYNKGDRVRSYTDKVYKSLIDNNLGNDVLDTEYWAEFDLLTDYLSDLETRGIKKVATTFIRDKVIGMETKNIIDRRCLFDGTGRIEARIPNGKKLVGFEITPLRSKGVTTKIEKIGLQFIGNTGDVTMYLFHSSKREPVWTKTFNYNKSNGTFLWFDVEDSFLPYVSNETNAGGSWYLVYDQTALPPYMEGINFGRDWSREPCGTCNKGDLALWRLMTKYVEFSPFYVNAEQWNGELWDINQNIYTNTLNYGINVMFSVGCDLTDTMIASRLDFANVIQLQVASDALRSLALNPEVSVNRVQYNADRNNILYETDGNGEGIKGLAGDLTRAYKALSFDTKGLDDTCLTCKSKGVRFGSI